MELNSDSIKSMLRKVAAETACCDCGTFFYNQRQLKSYLRFHQQWSFPL